jgi:hypothetical protein
MTFLYIRKETKNKFSGVFTEDEFYIFDLFEVYSFMPQLNVLSSWP